MLQLVATVGFIIAISVIFIYSRSILKLKDMQIQSEKVISIADQIKSGFDNIMTSNVDLFEQKAGIIDLLNEFGVVFNQFRDPEMIKYLPKEDARIISDLVDNWFTDYESKYLDFFRNMDILIVDPVIGEYSGQELLRIKNELYRTYKFNTLNKVYAFESVLKSVSSSTNRFILDLDDGIVILRDFISEAIFRSIIISVLVSIVTSVIGLLSITIFSRRIGTRIIQMRDAIKSLSQGDFSHELHIKSGDEFEKFSDHFNVFKDELWEKLDSVLDFMLQISGSISVESNLDRIMEIVVDSGVKNTGADAGSIFLVDEIDDSMIKVEVSVGVLPPLFYVPPEYSKDIIKLKEIIQNTPILTGETLIGKSVSEGVNFFIREVSAEEDLEQNKNEDSLLYISSIMIVPLIITGRVLGTLVLAKKTPGDFFTDIDFNHIRTFSDYAALTIDNIYNYHELIEKSELHREIKIAADIQKNLLPDTIPDTKGLMIAAFTEAARGVSGDYYDFFRLDRNKTAIVICDVVGKGVPASLLMIMIRTIIRLAASPRRSAAQILTILNRAIIGRTEADQFATMSFIIYDESTKEISYANAAHAPLLHYHSRSRKFAEVDTPGLPIGIESSEQYEQKTITLEDGDLLALYTDGITEARNISNKEYSQYSLQRVLKIDAGLSPEKIVSSVRSDLASFVGDSRQHDDQTLLILKAV